MRWYGYQSMVIDAARGQPVASGRREDRALWFGASPGQCGSNRPRESSGSSLVVYEFGGPTVHALHGHWPRPF
jgi:hypothetical protein